MESYTNFAFVDYFTLERKIATQTPDHHDALVHGCRARSQGRRVGGVRYAPRLAAQHLSSQFNRVDRPGVATNNGAPQATVMA
jgi:hypothetical protein